MFLIRVFSILFLAVAVAVGRTDTTPPTVPANLTATAASCSQVNLSWNASQDQPNGNNSGLKGYNVYRDGCFILQVATTYAIDTGLIESGNYVYTVSALDNATNESAPSAGVSVTTPAASPATDLRISVSGGNVVLNWAGTTGALYQAQSAASFWGPWSPMDAPTTNCTATSLAVQPNSAYRVAVFTRTPAYNSNSVTNRNDKAPPTVPSNLTASAGSCSQVNLAWQGSTDVGTTKGGKLYTSGLAGYLIYRNNVFLKQVDAQTTSASDTSVSASTTYSYAVAAIDNAGNRSANSTPASVTTPSCSVPPPSAPTGLTGSAVSCTSVSLYWNAPTNSGSGLAYYKVYRNGSAVQQVTATGWTDNGVTASTNYTYAVTAVDTTGRESGQSNPVSVTTPACPDTTPPSMPTGLAATAASCSQVNLSWVASTDTGGSGLKGYNLYRGGSFLKQVLAPATTTSDTGLAASSSYSYTVSAVDNAGNPSAQSNPVSVTTPACPDTTPPSVPTGLAATAASCSQVNLSWVASTDSGGSGLKGYNLYRGGSFLKQVLAPATTTSDTGLAASSSYSYTVSAVDNAGNESARSSPVSVTTPACSDTTPPSMPTGFAATATSCTQINLSWNASTDSGGSGLKGYNIYRNGSFLKQVLAPVTSTSDTGLAASTSYSYTVSAVDNAGNPSAQTAAVAATTPPCNDNFANATLFSATPATGSNVGATKEAGEPNHAGNAGGKSVWWVWPATNIGPGVTATITTAGSSFDTLLGVYTGSTVSSLTTVASNDNDPSGGLTSRVDFGVVPGTSYRIAVDGFNGASGNITLNLSLVAGACAFTLTPTSASYTAAGGNATVNVSSCDYVATSSATWLSITSGATGNNGGNIGYTVAANAGTSLRTATLNVTNLYYSTNFTVIQAGDTTGTPGQLQWVKTGFCTAGGGGVFSKGLAADSVGNTVSVGLYRNNVGATTDFGTGPISTLNGSSDAFIIKYDQQGNPVWLKHFGSSGEDYANAVAIDSQNNIIVVGSFNGTVDVSGGQNPGLGTLTSAANYDIFVAKYDSANPPNLVWAKRFGGNGGDMGIAVALDRNQNIFLAARILSTDATFDSITLSSAGSYDVALAKLSSSGTVLWAKRWGGAGNDSVYGLAVDPAGNAIITGQFWGVSNFGGGSRTNTDPANLYPDIFLAKYSGGDGSYRWDKCFGGTSYDGGYGVTVDPTTTNVVVTGTFVGTVDFGGGGISAGIGGVTMFLAGYDPSGNYLWARAFGGDGRLGFGFDSGKAVTISDAGILALTGQLSSPVLFGTWPEQSYVYGNGYFVATYSLSGNSPPVYRWAKYSGTGAPGIGNGVALDTFGHILTSGSFQMTTDFGGIAATAPLSTDAAFVAQYWK